MSGRSEDITTGRRPWSTRRAFVASFLAFFLVFSAWAFATPYGGAPDEVAHAIRAAGVASFSPAQVFAEPSVVADSFGNPGMGATQRVPAGLGSLATCFGLEPRQPANCATPIAGGPITEVDTPAGRYHPLYYALVGLPLRHLPGWPGLVLSRLISAALCAALLACAFVVLARTSRSGLMLGGLLVVCTPMLAHLAGAVNPNGLEIAAGIAFFAAGIPLLLGPRPDGGVAARHLVTLAGISAVLVMTLRSLGPLWILAALFALLVPLRRARLRELWGDRPMRRNPLFWWSVGVAASLLLSVAWIVGQKTGDLVPPPPGRYDYTIGTATLEYVNNWDIYLEGMVGVAGWFDVHLWAPLVPLWISFAALLILLGLAGGGWVDRWRFGVLFAGGVIVPGILQVSQATVTGFIIGGRYMLPLLVGAPLLGAYLAERRGLDPRLCRTLLRMCCLALPPVHAALLVMAMTRWQRGFTGGMGPGYFNPLAGVWHPPTGSLPPVLLMLAGLVLMVAVFWRVPVLDQAQQVPSQQPERSARTAPTDTAVPDGQTRQDGDPLTLAGLSDSGR